jgi:YidC/Oxa1 family membrane protein insertase
MWDAIIITPFINALLFIYTMVGGNFGIAIILFTILIRVVTHPLMVQQIKGSQGMQELQKNPRWIEAQEKYKNDKEKLAQEQMALYKELKINPFGACLPMLIQFPVIIGLYQAIIQAMANTPYDMLKLVRHVYPGFLDIASLVPLNNRFLWMDLGQPERLNIPGIPFAIPILAVLVVVTTYLQSKLMAPPPAQGGGKDQSAQMMGMMNLYMPIFMGWLAWTLASGLALYFVVSNVVGILQYAILGKANWKALVPGYKPQPVTAPQQVKPSRGKNESRKNNARSNRTNS